MQCRWWYKVKRSLFTIFQHSSNKLRRGLCSFVREPASDYPATHCTETAKQHPHTPHVRVCVSASMHVHKEEEEIKIDERKNKRRKRRMSIPCNKVHCLHSLQLWPSVLLCFYCSAPHVSEWPRQSPSSADEASL